MADSVYVRGITCFVPPGQQRSMLHRLGYFMMAMPAAAAVFLLPLFSSNYGSAAVTAAAVATPAPLPYTQTKEVVTAYVLHPAISVGVMPMKPLLEDVSDILIGAGGVQDQHLCMNSTLGAREVAERCPPGSAMLFSPSFSLFGVKRNDACTPAGCVRSSGTDEGMQEATTDLEIAVMNAARMAIKHHSGNSFPHFLSRHAKRYKKGADKCLAGLKKATSNDDLVAMASLLAEADQMGYAGEGVEEARATVQRSELEIELRAGISASAIFGDTERLALAVETSNQISVDHALLVDALRELVNGNAARASAEFVQVKRSAAEACEETLSFAESRAISRQDAIEARAKASAETAAMKAASEMSDLTSRLAAQQHRNDVVKSMLRDAERQRAEEMERSESTHRQLEAAAQKRLKDSITRSTNIEEAMQASLEKERRRTEDAEGRMRAALERITHLEAEAAQRETKTHALEAKIQELNDHVVATETRLAEALVTEAKALHDIEGVREDRFEYEILAAEAAERSDGMRAEKNLAFKTAQDAGKKLDVCTASLAASEGQVTALTKENMDMRDDLDNRAHTISGMSEEIVAISLYLEDINNPEGYTLSQGTMLRAFILSYASLPATTRRELDDVVTADLYGDVGPRNIRNLTAAMDHMASATGFRLVKWVPGSSIFAVLVHESGLPEVAVIAWLTGVTVYAAIIIVTSIWVVIARVLAVTRHTVPQALGRGASAARHAVACALQRLANSVRAVDDLFARGRHRIEAAWDHPVQAADDLFMFVLAVLRVDGRVLSAMFGVMTGIALVLGWLVVGVGQE